MFSRFSSLLVYVVAGLAIAAAATPMGPPKDYDDGSKAPSYPAPSYSSPKYSEDKPYAKPYSDKYPRDQYPKDKYAKKYPMDKYAKEQRVEEKDVKDKYPQDKYPKDKYAEKYPKEKYPEDKYPKDKYPEEECLEDKDAKDKYPKDKYPEDKYPKEEHHEEKYPEDKYSKDKYPKDKYPKEERYEEKYPEDKYPKEERHEDKDAKDKYPKDKYSEDKYPKEKRPEDKDAKQKNYPRGPAFPGSKPGLGKSKSLNARPQNSNNCNVGSQTCCNPVNKSDNKDSEFQGILAGLGLMGNMGDITQKIRNSDKFIGKDCSPDDTGDQCTASPMCCEDNTFVGVCPTASFSTRSDILTSSGWLIVLWLLERQCRVPHRCRRRMVVIDFPA
jgi:hypothetical protein